MDKPKSIYLSVGSNNDWYRDNGTRPLYRDDVKYIRADVVEKLEAENARLSTDLEVTKTNLERRDKEVGWVADRCDRQEKVIEAAKKVYKIMDWDADFVPQLGDAIDEMGKVLTELRLHK